MILAACSSIEVAEPSLEALRYYLSGNILWLVSLILTLAFPLLFLIKKFSLICERFSFSYSKSWLCGNLVYLLIYQVVSWLFFLPIEIYGGFYREKDYGLSNQTFLNWFSDHLKSSLIDSLFFSIGALSIFFLIKKSKKFWWVYAWVVMIFFNLFSTIIQPVWIDPLFNTFSPMKDKRLEKEILCLCEKAGIGHAEVVEVNKSMQTNALNAYVTGAFGSHRIVLWDTLIKKMTCPEILFVMGHEMGHYVLHHVMLDILYFSFLSFLILYLIHKGADYFITLFGPTVGIKNLASIASLPILLLLFQLCLFITNPISLAFSRHLEHQADVFGLEITENNEAAARAFVVLQSSNLANPYPGQVYQFFRGSHPSLGERIRFCNTYCPWKKSEPLKYKDYFKEKDF